MLKETKKKLNYDGILKMENIDGRKKIFENHKKKYESKKYREIYISSL